MHCFGAMSLAPDQAASQSGSARRGHVVHSSWSPSAAATGSARTCVTFNRLNELTLAASLGIVCALPNACHPDGAAEKLGSKPTSPSCCLVFMLSPDRDADGRLRQSSKEAVAPEKPFDEKPSTFGAGLPF